MTKYLNRGATDDNDRGRCLQPNLFIVNIVSSRKNISLEYIKRNTAYNTRKTTTAIQRTLNFNRIVVSGFGYDNFLRGNWEMSSIVQEVS